MFQFKIMLAFLLFFLGVPFVLLSNIFLWLARIANIIPTILAKYIIKFGMDILDISVTKLP